MGVFISWSGKNSISYNVAMLLRDWLPNVIQTVKPFLSAVDIDAGSQWVSQMFQALKETQVGIICVTRTNQSEPWINFEAGALAKAMESSRVCPLLIDVRPADVTGPLTTLQMQPLDKDGLFSVLKVLNQYCGSQPLTDEALRKAFDKWWSEFETGLAKIMSAQEPSKPRRRDSEDMLEEILSRVRSIDKATSSAPYIGSLTTWMGEWAEHAAGQSPVERLKGSFAQSSMVALVAEVAKSDPQLSEILAHGSPEFADKTLIIKFAVHPDTGFEYLIKPYI